MARIVIMEDEASTRRLITGVLKKAGHEVSDFDNGAEGLLTVLAELPDLVVSDVEMPKINGFEVLSDIRNAPETAHTPVILLTSRSSQEDIRHGLAQGANEYLTKPFDPTTLLAAVERQLLAKHQGGAGDEADSAFEATRPADLVFPSLGAPQTPDLQLVAMAHQEEPEPIASRHLGQAWAVSMPGA
ncbi:MAG: response regulator [Brachymonas sp.]|nr:response regulator [Brachymonas sp.]